MDPAKYVDKSEFAQRSIAVGRNEARREGAANGKLELTKRLLRRLFGRRSASVRARLSAASPE